MPCNDFDTARSKSSESGGVPSAGTRTDCASKRSRYWRAREATGDGVRTVATALGVARVSLRRWAQDPRFRPVRVLAEAASAPTGLVVVIDATGVRVEGMDVETAAQLIARLR